MTTPAVFRCTYSDWKVVKGRKVIQVVLEMPLETADTAYQVLGGMPSPAAEVWCAVARLNEVPAPLDLSVSSDSSGEREPESDPGSRAERGHKSPAQIAGYLCTLGSFQGFLEDHHPKEWLRAINNVRDPGRLVPYSEVAAECVRILCKVKSRTYLTERNTEWNSLLLAFRAVEKAAEVVPA